jgi:hypothetical protein
MNRAPSGCAGPAGIGRGAVTTIQVRSATASGSLRSRSSKLESAWSTVLATTVVGDSVHRTFLSPARPSSGATVLGLGPFRSFLCANWCGRCQRELRWPGSCTGPVGASRRPALRRRGRPPLERVDRGAELAEGQVQRIDDAPDRGPGRVDLRPLDTSVGGDAQPRGMRQGFLADSFLLAQRADGAGKGGIDAGPGWHIGQLA